ncbi:MAG: hypothetical protein ACOY15_07620 [Pseudomonadota bacterium]
MTLRNTFTVAICAATLSLGLLPVTAAQADEAMKKKIMSNCEMMMKGDMTMKDAMMKDDMMKKCDMMMKGEAISDADMMKMDDMMMKDGMKK